MTTWIKSSKREFKDIKEIFKEDTNKEISISDIKLIGFLQKQSNSSLPNSNVKIYKKKWFWFDTESGVLYYTNQQQQQQQQILQQQQQQQASNNGNNSNSVSIKSIVISQSTIIEQSKAFRLDFTITNEKINKHYILRGNDEQSVIKWVSSINSWKKIQQQKIEQERQQSLELQKKQEQDLLKVKLELEEQEKLLKQQQQQQQQQIESTVTLNNKQESDHDDHDLEIDVNNNIISIDSNKSIDAISSTNVTPPFTIGLNNSNDDLEISDDDNNNNNNINIDNNSNITNNKEYKLKNSNGSYSLILTNSTSTTEMDSTSPSYTPPSTSSDSSPIGSPLACSGSQPTNLKSAVSSLTIGSGTASDGRTTQHELQLFMKSILKNDISLDSVSNKVQQLFFRYPTLLYQEQISYIQERLKSQIDYFTECLQEINYLNSPFDVNDGLTKTTTTTTPNIMSLSSEDFHPKGSLMGSIENSIIHEYIDEDSDVEDAYHYKEEEEEDILLDEDMFVLLPNHLSLYIFSFLEPNELLTCAQISKQWQILTEDNLLWVRFVFHLMTPASIFDTTHKWKQVYLNHYSPKLKKTTKEHYMNRSITATSSSLALSSTVSKEGWLYKRGEDLLKIWKKRYFVAQADSLFYFKNPSDNIPCGMILLNSKTYITRASHSSRKHSFKIVQPKFHHGIERKRMPYYLSADKDQDCQEWMSVLMKIIKSKGSQKESVNFKQLHYQEAQQHLEYLKTHSSADSPKQTHHKKSISLNNSLNFSYGSGSGSPSSPSSPPTLHKSQTLERTNSSRSSNGLMNGSMKDLHQVFPVNPVFGVPITALMENQKIYLGQQHLAIQIPWILHKCFNYLLENGLTEVGIFRVSGSVRESIRLQEEFEGHNPAGINLDLYDIHSITSTIKTFFRKLPNSLITTDLDEYATAVQMASSQTEEEKLSEYKFIFESLDTLSYQILKSFLYLLKQIIKNESTNKMTLENLLIVIMPNLKCSPILITNGLKYYDQLFN